MYQIWKVLFLHNIQCKQVYKETTMDSQLYIKESLHLIYVILSQSKHINS